ncbi:UPF0746 protein DDB_G0281095-like [Dendronephthya gigantea]|uniref:UPF0746 protein DDB_G0281095-like n=1 Tax=Dendronephthya gigantea TaxID=151771 RepID=UPI00106C1536|nr:UPF0746 protein DDB_G0281095-like [Dendronephthya gigantea]
MAEETISTKPIKSTIIMSWTDEKDVIFCREILVSKLFVTKKSSPERGQVWNDIADRLCQLQQPNFRVNQKSVRDHYKKLVAGYKRKMRDELNASGISPEQTEIDILLEEIVEREAAQVAEKENIDNENNRRMEAEKVAADDIRRKAMETLAQTNKRKAEESNETPKKKRRSSGSETIAYLQEKTEIEMELRKEEMEIKRAEVELEKNKMEQQMKQQATLFEQQGNMMQAMMEQQQQQQQQMQALQMLVLQQQQQQSQALIALLDKLSK